MGQRKNKDQAQKKSTRCDKARQESTHTHTHTHTHRRTGLADEPLNCSAVFRKLVGLKRRAQRRQKHNVLHLLLLHARTSQHSFSAYRSTHTETPRTLAASNSVAA